MPEIPSRGEHPADRPGAGDASTTPLSRRQAREAQHRVSPSVPDDSGRAAQPESDARVGEPVLAAAGARPAPRPEPPARSTAPIDALFEEQGMSAPATVTRHDRDRRKSRVAAWTVFAVILAILGGLAAGGVWVWNTYEDQIRAVMGWEEPKDYEPGLAEGEAVVTIVSGDTGADVSRTLHEAGVTKTSDAFYDYLIGAGENPRFVPGAFSLQQKMTSEDALAAIMDPENKLESTVQLREGLTVGQSVERIAEGVGLALEDVEAAVADPSAYGVDQDTLEGWLFPATYTFDPGVTAEGVVQRMVDRTVEALDAAGVPEERREEILTIASIIEKEARYEKDFYKVSRVIQNRLDPAISETDGLLQMDSTAQYAFTDRDGGTSSTDAELTDDNPWNTYVNPGLPVGPIANPGELAIKAAMNPEDGPWQYFVTVDLGTGETVFTSTFAEHEQAVEQYRQWCRDNPGGGC